MTLTDNLINEIRDNKEKFNFDVYDLKPKLLGVVGNMVNIKDSNLTAFNKNIKNKYKDDHYKLFKNYVRNNTEFMDMGDLIPAVMKKTDTITRKKVAREINEVVKEFEEKINE